MRDHTAAAIGPRRFRAHRVAPVAAAGHLAELVELFLTHLADGAYSARGAAYSPKTVQSYGEGLRRLLSMADAIGIPDDAARLRREHIERFITGLRAAGCKPKTISGWTSAVSAFCGWLVNRGVLSASPLTGVKRPRPTAEPVQPFTEDDLERLLRACDERTWIGARNAAIIWTLLDTGLRGQELCSLDIADLDRREWTIRSLVSRAFGTFIFVIMAESRAHYYS